MTLTWGLLGPGKLASERRTRTLGVASSIRSFNDLAVPGLGGVWFGKQLFLATLGVRIAQCAGEEGKHLTNIETANAVEALACWLAFDSNDWTRDPRLRGSTKMQGKTDLGFKALRQRSFYVTQPMRMATVQALPALGLVEADSVRFNAFACSQAGNNFLDAACEGFLPFKRSVIAHLLQWALSKEDSVTSPPLRAALSPTIPLPERARELLMERLIQGAHSESTEAKQRRRAALDWVESLRSAPSPSFSWETRPAQITSSQHWEDLKAGALFQSARDAAIAVLDALEAHIGNLGHGQRFSLLSRVPDAVTLRLVALRRAADIFLKARHTDKEANAFCGECSSEDHAKVLKQLVERDERVLRLKGQEVVPGPAFRGVPLPKQDNDENRDDDDSDIEAPRVKGSISWPQGLSPRIPNLFLLNADLRGELDQWLDITSTRQDNE